MQPIEKAREIFSYFLNLGKGLTSDFHAQQCAELAVNLIIIECDSSRTAYWEQVIKHLKNILE